MLCTVVQWPKHGKETETASRADFDKVHAGWSLASIKAVGRNDAFVWMGQRGSPKGLVRKRIGGE